MKAGFISFVVSFIISNQLLGNIDQNNSGFFKSDGKTKFDSLQPNVEKVEMEYISKGSTSLVVGNVYTKYSIKFSYVLTGGHLDYFYCNAKLHRRGIFEIDEPSCFRSDWDEIFRFTQTKEFEVGFGFFFSAEKLRERLEDRAQKGVGSISLYRSEDFPSKFLDLTRRVYRKVLTFEIEKDGEVHFLSCQATYNVNAFRKDTLTLNDCDFEDYFESEKRSRLVLQDLCEGRHCNTP